MLLKFKLSDCLKNVQKLKKKRSIEYYTSCLLVNTWNSVRNMNVFNNLLSSKCICLAIEFCYKWTIDNCYAKRLWVSGCHDMALGTLRSYPFKGLLFQHCMYFSTDYYHNKFTFMKWLKKFERNNKNRCTSYNRQPLFQPWHWYRIFVYFSRLLTLISHL